MHFSFSFKERRGDFQTDLVAMTDEEEALLERYKAALKAIAKGDVPDPGKVARAALRKPKPPLPEPPQVLVGRQISGSSAPLLERKIRLYAFWRNEMQTSAARRLIEIALHSGRFDE
jgi:hypothetical protein